MIAEKMKITFCYKEIINFFWGISICLSVTACSIIADKKENESTSISFTNSISYDSIYWSLDTVNRNDFFVNNELPNSIELDSMNSARLEANKQILKDIYIEYRKRNGDSEDPEPSYYRNADEFKITTSAFLNCLYYYLYSHGYKKIDESIFKQKLQIFYSKNWNGFYKIGDFFGYSDENKKITEDLYNVPSFVCELENSVVYSKLHENPIRVWIELDDEEGENEDAEIDEFGNTITHVNIESLEKGILNIDKDLMDLDKLLYEHLFVFNNNKAAKNWLICNRIEAFFFDFPYYDDEDEINRKKLKYMLNECTHGENVIVGRNDDLVYYSLVGHHNNMLKLIFEETDKAMTTYENGGKYDTKAFDLMYDYFKILYVNNKDDKKIAIKNQINQLEKLCVFLKMEVSLNKKHCKHNNFGWFNDSDALSITFQCLNDSLLEVAKQHNYYNIPNFDEVLKVYKWDSENAYRDKSGIPFDYTTLLESD